MCACSPDIHGCVRDATCGRRTNTSRLALESLLARLRVTCDDRAVVHRAARRAFLLNPGCAERPVLSHVLPWRVFQPASVWRRRFCMNWLTRSTRPPVACMFQTFNDSKIIFIYGGKTSSMAKKKSLSVHPPAHRLQAHHPRHLHYRGASLIRNNPS